jgi:hypothetical protein
MITQKKLSLKDESVYFKFSKGVGKLEHVNSNFYAVIDWHCFKHEEVRTYCILLDSGKIMHYSHNELLNNFVLVVDVECKAQFTPLYECHADWRDYKKNDDPEISHYLRRWVDEDGNQVCE